MASCHDADIVLFRNRYIVAQAREIAEDDLLGGGEERFGRKFRSVVEGDALKAHMAEYRNELLGHMAAAEDIDLAGGAYLLYIEIILSEDLALGMPREI